MLDALLTSYPKQGTILDIGANVGNHAVYFETYFDFDRLICFEPHPTNFSILKSNINSSKTEIIDKALGDHSGRVSLVQGESNNFGIIKTVDGDDVEMITLDSLDLQDVTLMKIDVEGNEMDVLKGGIETIKRCGPVILAEAQTDAEFANLFEFLSDFGYTIGRKFICLSIPTYEFIKL